jgi:hypothetical protein
MVSGDVVLEMVSGDGFWRCCSGDVLCNEEEEEEEVCPSLDPSLLCL